MAISSRHCLREASPELVKRLSCWPFLISDSSWAVGALLISGLGLAWPTASAHPSSTHVSLPESLRTGHQRPLPCTAKGEAKKKRGLCWLLVDEHSWGKEYMQGLTKWRQNVLPDVCVCLSVCAKQEEEEGPLGLCPFAVILIQLYTRCAPPPKLHHSCSSPPRAEYKQL